jgi:TDG/mug DNA glycosylase family protein
MKNQAIHLAKSMRETNVRPLQGTLSRQRLTDHIRPGVRILFVGINPGLRSAATGHHFAGHSNRFWKVLFESKLVPEPLTHQDDWRLPDWGLGLTNIIQRPSAGIDVLKPREYVAGRKRLIATVKRYRPHVVALLGVTIYRTLFPEYRTGRISLGLQDETLADCPVFVLPNPSGRNAHYSYRTMLMSFRALRSATNKPFLM